MTYFLEREEGREKERERNINVKEKHQLVAFCMPSTGDTAHNSGMCPDGESNQQPFSLQNDAQPNEPYHSGQKLVLYCGIHTLQKLKIQQKIFSL